MPLIASDHIVRYRNYLERTTDQQFLIPDDFIEEFWTWFENKGKLFEGSKIQNKLPDPGIKLHSSACFGNSYRIANAFVKRYIYFEGFAYSYSRNEYLMHAFNTNKYRTVYDFTLKGHPPSQDQFDTYVGVRIPLALIRSAYNELGFSQYTQYTMLAIYFLYSNNLDFNFDYCNLPSI